MTDSNSFSYRESVVTSVLRIFGCTANGVTSENSHAKSGRMYENINIQHKFPICASYTITWMYTRNSRNYFRLSALPNGIRSLELRIWDSEQTQTNDDPDTFMCFELFASRANILLLDQWMTNELAADVSLSWLWSVHCMMPRWVDDSSYS